MLFFSVRWLWIPVVCALAADVSLGTTIGNVSSFSSSGQDVTFSIDDGSKVRLTILADDLVRVSIAPDGSFGTNISQAVAKTDWPAAPFSTTDNGSNVSITTSEMKLIVNKGPFTLECRDASDNLMVQDDPSRRIQWDGGDRTEVYKQTQENEDYLGLGWRTHGLVRNGTTFWMRNKPTYSDPDTFYSGVPLWYGMRNGQVYGIFFDDTSWGYIKAGSESSDYMSFHNIGGQLEYYYFAGPTMAKVLDRYTELTGRPYMPPRWAVGYQQCRWSYWNESMVLNIANEFRTRSIPCDVIYLDIDYMNAGKQLTFDPSTFPDPADLCTTLHNQGFRVVANISPWLMENSPKWSYANSQGYLLTHNGSALTRWNDVLAYLMGGATGWQSWVDFTNPVAKNWYAGEHVPFLQNGIDGIWNDLNEPDEFGTWPDDVKYDFDGNPVDHSKTSTQYCLLQTEFSYQVLQNQYPNHRPFVISRGGYAGIQRYAALWSGDNAGNWDTHLQVNIPMGLSMSICGNPFNGHDIGGFFGYPDIHDKLSDELYARWMQCGVFSPFCRQHHTSEGRRTNFPNVEPWEFGTTVEAICRDWIGLRYRLMPYLYTLFYNAHTTGEPIQRPTLYDFPDDASTLTQDYDFMFGPYMLVSPVTLSGAGTWPTYLPDGADWIDWWDDSLNTGGQTVNTSVPLERIPIFVRGGAIIPMAPVSQYEGETAWDEITFELYPIDETSNFTIYEDDGISWDYQSGEYAETTCTMSGIGDSFIFDIAARQGSYVPTPRTVVLKVHRWPGHTRLAGLNQVVLDEHADKPAFDAADSGIYLDPTDILWVKFADTGNAMTFAFGAPNVPGDMDHDGDVDQTDFGLFQACYTAPGQASGDPACDDADFDGDVDVDLADYGAFQRCYSGPTVLGDPNCLSE